MNLLRIICVILFLFSSFITYVEANDEKNRLYSYIILNQAAHGVDTSDSEKVKAVHNEMLSTVCKDSDSRLLYSYNKVTNGFAAKLSVDEVRAMEIHPLFMRAIPANEPYKLLTTHTPDFLKLRGSNGLWGKTKNMGEGIIVGILDSGVSPGHPSFDGKGMPTPPAKWKGHCDFNASVCNNKLIGAKSFLRAGADELKHISPFDEGYHGTHTASTAVGAFVKDVNVSGMVMGEASGIAPRAHLAVYKVCGIQGCAPPDVIKGIEEAVNDGCDVISLSLAITKDHDPFYLNAIAVGGFYAILKGVFVSTGAGNSGPQSSTISNAAPWLLTVGASTTDRRIRSTVMLGNNLQLLGESLYQPKNWTNNMFPLVYPAGEGFSANASKCVNGTLDSKLIRGKIVLCDRGVNGRVEKGLFVLEAGGVGMILANEEADDFSTTVDMDIHVLPASAISYTDGLKIKDYIRTTKKPTGTFLFQGVAYNNPYSPSIGSFSSRGPSVVSPLILKPDITGPGVSILAAIPPLAPPGQPETPMFYFSSGTSMATPHLTGIVAILRKQHPDWSPAAIKSAIMTTAGTTTMDGKEIIDESTGKPADPFVMGAGHVNPNKALDPGLVYDLAPEDYINYLCGLGYEDDDVNAIIHPAPKVKCSRVKAIPEEQLNYPSITVFLNSSTTKTISRTVTNVGEANAIYKAMYTAPKGTTMKVEPSVLNFTKLNEKQSFNISFELLGKSLVATGDLKWISGNYVVRSPIIITN